ncbi:hypothetical protein L7F22_016812 [Adiantum nelumboides]|nr:hypothetical protein [Adiantum nelumboides]
MSIFAKCCCGGGAEINSSDENQGWRIFTLKEVLAVTQNFSNDNKLGEGGFGSVYWGQLQNGSQIAVKRLKVWTSKAEMEFAVEVEILGRARHKNLLSLRGYCAEGQERLIIYDFMPNLSLLSHLHGQFATEGHLDWRRRMRIALGSAEGIAYLHHYASPHIIHRDVKASNVLLDANFEAHVADFGFAKLIPEGVSHVTTRVKGTLGYLAPEYALWGKVSESCDVYSFGILLFELISSRKPIEKLGSGQKRTIVEWAGPLVYEGKVDELVDPKLKGQFEESELRRLVYVAAMCAQSSPEKRPTMREVVESLKGEGLPFMPSVENSQEERHSVTLEAVKYGDKLLAEDDDDMNDENVACNHPVNG